MFSGGSITPSSPKTIAGSGTDCEYNEAQLLGWRELLLCLKARNLYDTFGTSEKAVNAALGIIISAINQRANLCYYQGRLDRIFPLIISINSYPENICS
jgi:hypothetical protein